MNRDYLNRSVGRYVQLRAKAIHLNANDVEQGEPDDDWLVESYSARVLQIKNTRTSSTGLLYDDSVHSFRENAARGVQYGYLMLLAQTFVRGTEVFFEPVTRPGERLAFAPTSLLEEALFEASLACHRWKNEFMKLRAPGRPENATGEYVDVWDLMAADWIPDYTQENYGRFLPLFTAAIGATRSRFDRLIQLFQNVLPQDYQAEIVRGSRQLEVEQVAYTQLPMIKDMSPKWGTDTKWFQGRFIGVINVLRRCAREADRRRDLLPKRPPN